MPDTETTDTPMPAFDPVFLKHVKEAEAHFNEQNAWDIPPQIYLWHPPVMAGLHIPEKIWKRMDFQPPLMLEFIAANWEDVKTSLIQQDPIMFSRPPQGILLVSEGWGFDLDAVDETKAAEYHRIAEAGAIHMHPDRIENRTITAVDANGNRCFMCRIRGGSVKSGFGTEISGLVPDALSFFLTRVTKARPL